MSEPDFHIQNGGLVMKNILVSQPLHEAAMERLYNQYNVFMPVPYGQEAFEALLPKADGMILRNNVVITESVIKTARNLKIICRTGAGLDNIPLQAARDMDIIVTNTPDANSISVAEHAVALILALSKYLPRYEKEARGGNWEIRQSFMPFELYGKTAGIVGLGRTGRIAAQILHDGFHMNIIAYGPSVDPSKYPAYTITKTVEEVFTESDVVSMHCPSTDATRGMVNAALLSRSKPGMLFINCARGNIVVENDLVAALQSGQVSAAGLDVVSPEPINPDSPLLKLDNVLLTPHSAALTKEASVRMFDTAVEQLNAYFSGSMPNDIVK
jgi:D-3-phosphoglycerate dehydrogenase